MKDVGIVWWGNNGNWGDEINPLLYSYITGTPKEKVDRVYLGDETGTSRYYCVGSILDYTYSGNYEVWGTGIGGPDVHLVALPKKVHAVRGPLTRQVLLKHNIECPEIYGDPALLLPKYYTPDVKKEYKYGVIAHFSHKRHTWLDLIKERGDVNVIDVIDYTGTTFIDEVNKCEVILSSSLHGLICSDAYEIPSYWIDLSNGGHVNWFKFHDYFRSVGRPLVKPMLPDTSGKIEELFPPMYNYFIDINLDELLSVCPFKK